MTTDTQPSEAPPPPGPLVRPLERRVVVGVAAALSDRLGIPLLLIRIAFALLTVVGGLGLFLYLAGWLLIRGEGEAEIPAVRLGRRIGTAQGWIGVALVALAAIIILDNTTFFRGSLLWAVVLLVVGVLLYRGDLGRIGTRPAPPPEVEGPPEGSAPAVPTGPAPESPAGHPGSLVVEGGGFPPPPPMADSYPPGPSAPPSRSVLGRITLALALVALGGLALADNLLPTVDAQPRHYLALATMAIGLGLLAGSVWGKARWLILIGVVLVPPLVISPVAEYGLRNLGDQHVIPASFDQLQPGYELPFGALSTSLSSHGMGRSWSWPGM